MEDNRLVDFLGRSIEENDIVARAIFSRHTFHKVIKITKKGVYLSRGVERRSYQYPEHIRNPQTGRYERTGVLLTNYYQVIGGSNTIEGVNNHDRKIYLLRNNISLIKI